MSYLGRNLYPVTAHSKSCPRCQQVKPASEFPIDRARYDGLQSYCRPCTRERAAENRLAARIALLEFLGGRCVRCGFSDWRALQIDHVNGGGAVDRATGRSQGYVAKRVRANPSRFQVLCANCNSIKRVEEGEHTGPRKYESIVVTERVVRPRRTPAKAQAYSVRRTVAAKKRQDDLIDLVEKRRVDQKSPTRLPNGSWSRWYEKCLGCQETSRKHVSDGLCWRCNKLAKGLNRRPSVYASEPAA